MFTFSLRQIPLPILRPIALMAGVLFSGGPASACYTVKIENTSQQEIRGRLGRHWMRQGLGR